jgi:hypothetical protein
MDLVSGRNDPALVTETPAPSVAAPLEATAPPMGTVPTVILHRVGNGPLMAIVRTVILLPEGIALRTVTVQTVMVALLVVTVRRTATVMVALLVVTVRRTVIVQRARRTVTPVHATSVLLMEIVPTAIPRRAETGRLIATAQIVILHHRGIAPLMEIVLTVILRLVGIARRAVIVQRARRTVIVLTVTSHPVGIARVMEIGMAAPLAVTAPPLATETQGHPVGIVPAMAIVTVVLLGATVRHTVIGRSAIPHLEVTVPSMATAPRALLMVTLPLGVTGLPMETGNVRYAPHLVTARDVIPRLARIGLLMATVTQGPPAESDRPMATALSAPAPQRIHVLVHAVSVPSAFVEVLSKRR